MQKYRNYPVTEYRDLREMLIDRAEKSPEKAALMQKKKGKWLGISYRRYLANINALGTDLIWRGLQGKKILLIGENGVFWATAYLAVICGVGTVVPMDPEITPKQAAHIAEFTEAAAVIYSSSAEGTVSQMPESVMRIPFEALPRRIAHGGKLIADGYRTYLDADIEPRQTAVILFSAISAKTPKGVMLSHKNLCFNIAEMCRMVQILPGDLFLSVLPMHHAYECTCGFLCPLSCGATVAFADSLADMSESMKEVHPSVILTLPPLLEFMYRKLLVNIEKCNLEKRVADLIKTTNAIPGRALRLSTKKSAFSAIHAGFGGNLRLLITIGASVSPAVLADFQNFGIPAIQAYGFPECSPLAAINRDTYSSLPSVGLTTPNTVIDIAQMQENGIGEVRIKGDHIMQGYYKMPKATAAVLKKGWFYTGDLGRLDKNGFLHIVGNKKNTIPCTNGKVVFPEELEQKLCRTPLVKEAMVVGEKRGELPERTVVAVLYPDENRFRKQFGENATNERLEAELKRDIAEINAGMPPYKQIKDLRIRRSPFPKTASGKLIR